MWAANNTYPQANPPCTQTWSQTERGFQTGSDCPARRHSTLAPWPSCYFPRRLNPVMSNSLNRFWQIKCCKLLRTFLPWCCPAAALHRCKLKSNSSQTAPRRHRHYSVVVLSGGSTSPRRGLSFSAVEFSFRAVCFRHLLHNSRYYA